MATKTKAGDEAPKVVPSQRKAAFLALKPHLDKLNAPNSALKASPALAVRSIRKFWRREFGSKAALIAEWQGRPLNDPDYPPQQAPLAVRLERLAQQGEFDATILTRLPQAALALSYANRRHAFFADQEGKATVDSTLIDKAAALEEEMDAIIEYALHDKPEVVERLKFIRPGTSHEDLGEDLDDYAEIFEEHADVLAQDKFRYRPEYAPLARQYAAAIAASLEEDPGKQTRLWWEYVQKLMVMLEEDYEYLRAAALFLLRHEATERRFQIFTALARSPARRSATQSTEDLAPEDDENIDDEDEDEDDGDEDDEALDEEEEAEEAEEVDKKAVEEDLTASKAAKKATAKKAPVKKAPAKK